MKPAPRSSRAGFSLIELLVAVALAASVITTAVLAFQAFTADGGPRATYGPITVNGAPVAGVFFAPSYGRAAQAETLRTQFLADLQRATAVYCLGREEVNTFHPAAIAVPVGFRGDSLGLPSDFLALVAPAAATTFVPYRGASTATNVSVFILGPSGVATELSVLAVYDVDLTPTTAGTTPVGTYASVKRFAAGNLTDYYDVFYPAPPAAAGRTHAFNPVVACFERSVRVGLSGADDRFMQAAERPFYFLWWPDPSQPWLESDFAPTYAGTDPRAAYAAMGGRTAFFFVVPMFPAL